MVSCRTQSAGRSVSEGARSTGKQRTRTATGLKVVEEQSSKSRPRECGSPVSCDPPNGGLQLSVRYEHGQVAPLLGPLWNHANRVGLQAQANFSAPTFEPAHEARAGKRAALSVNLSQLQLRCSNSITGPQASSSRSELSAK